MSDSIENDIDMTLSTNIEINESVNIVDEKFYQDDKSVTIQGLCKNINKLIYINIYINKLILINNNNYYYYYFFFSASANVKNIHKLINEKKIPKECAWLIEKSEEKKIFKIYIEKLFNEENPFKIKLLDPSLKVRDIPDLSMKKAFAAMRMATIDVIDEKKDNGEKEDGGKKNIVTVI
jgi:hypothetical protein